MFFKKTIQTIQVYFSYAYDIIHKPHKRRAL